MRDKRQHRRGFTSFALATAVCSINTRPVEKTQLLLQHPVRPFLFFPTALVCSPNCSNRAASRSGNRPAFGERGWECYLCLGSARGREPGGEFGKRVPNKVKVFQSFIFTLTGRALPLLNNPVPVLDCPIVCPPPPPQGALTSPFHLVFSFSCLNSPNVCLHLELQGPRLHTTPPPPPRCHQFVVFCTIVASEIRRK